MKWWNTYIALVKHNCAGSGDNAKDLTYWRNNLFAGIIIYLLPFCLIALLPGLYWVYITGRYILGLVALLTVTCMSIVAFMPRIRQPVRKIIFLCCMYSFSCAQVFILGLAGPGLIYLLACCVICILIFSLAFRFWPAWINTFICILFAVAIVLGLVPRSQDPYHSAGEWLAVSTNLVFLSFLLAALIPRLFNGLQETINKEIQLSEEVYKQQQHLQQAHSKLEQRNIELERFAFVASHDLKEPLRMVTNFMGLLQNKYGGQLDEKAHTYIGFAIDGGKRLQKMIDDLLELSRSGRGDGVREMIDMNDILKEVKQNMFKLIEENSAEIIVKTKLPVLAVYRADIIRLIQNLLSNAIKFRKKEISPVIWLSATAKEKEWLFSIEDNGIGIEEEKFEKIFEIFGRLHSQETYKGTGIGLAICKKVTEYHGGRIWVEAEEAKGSTFYFTIKNETKVTPYVAASVFTHNY